MAELPARPCPARTLEKMEEGQTNLVFRKSSESSSDWSWKYKGHEREFLTRLCCAFIDFGAPAHHLEENMLTAAENLEVELSITITAENVLLSFSDDVAPTLPVVSGDWETVHLGDLSDVYRIFHRVLDYSMRIEDAIAELADISEREHQYKDRNLIFTYGIACSSTGPLVFGARPQDIPVLFLLGCCLGYLKKKVLHHGKHNDAVEFLAALITSCLARGLGSYSGDIFCFPALAQAPLVLLLPGYTIVCGCLQLSSTNKGAGSSRIIYAIVHAVILGFSVTIGTSLYGMINPNATTQSYCTTRTPIYFPYLFLVPLVICIMVLSQGRWRQLPAMVAVSVSGFAVTTLLRRKLVTEVATLCGAFTLGCFVNIYSAFARRSAAEILLAGLFIQVPSGLGAHGSLVGGLNKANVMMQPMSNGTAQANAAAMGADSIIDLRVPISMARVAIMIVLGLRLSSWLAHSLGQKRLNC